MFWPNHLHQIEFGEHFDFIVLRSLMAADEAQWDSFIFPWWKLFIDWPYFGNKTSGEITDIM